MSNLHILVIGAGSAGKRHARNLRQLDCHVSCFDPRADRLVEAAKEGTLVDRFTDLKRAIAAAAYDGFVIASPPVFHVEQLLQLAATSRWIFCEKPLGVDTASAKRVAASSARVLLGYTFRWWPPVAEFRRRLYAGEIGQVRHLRFVLSAHLADWHPGERYQDFFMASKEQGGGALLGGSHFIDLMLWILGRPANLFARVDKISELEINTEDNVDILVSYASGLRVNLHLDLSGRPNERSITAVGEAGTLSWSFEDNAVKLGKTGEPKWEVQSFSCERNEMFLGAAREFLRLIIGETATPSCSVADGLAVLEILDACRKSAETGAAVAL